MRSISFSILVKNLISAMLLRAQYRRILRVSEKRHAYI